MSEALFYGGLIALGVAVVLSVAAAVIFRLVSSKLNKRFDEEYGKER